MASTSYPRYLLLRYDDVCPGGSSGLLDNIINNWHLLPGETCVGATIWLRLTDGPARGWFEVLDVTLPIYRNECVQVTLFLFCVIITQ